MLLYNLISNDKDPFIPHQEATMEEVFACTCEKDVIFNSDEWEDISETCKDLINSMLNKDPMHRPDIETVVNHPWFTST